MEKTVLNVYKPLGQTPLQIINLLKEKFPQYKKTKIGYAGRLDPMARGVLILLLDEANKNRKAFEQLDKTYEFKVLFGVSTDTYDILGLITQTCPNTPDLKQRLTQVIPSFEGKRQQLYPPYSAARFKGRPLYWWARQKRLAEVQIPSKKITVYSLNLKNIKQIKAGNLNKLIEKRIKLVTGDFRQTQIIKKWQTFFKTSSVQIFKLATFTVTCSSGTYVRSLALEIGEKLNTCCLCFSLKRTRVGKFDIKNSWQLKS